MGFHDLFDDRQSNPGPSRLAGARLFPTIKAFEDVGEVFRGDLRSAVGQDTFNRARLSEQVDAGLSPLGRVTQEVLDQILNHLGDQGRIGVDRKGEQVDLEPDLFLVKARPLSLKDGENQFLKIEFLLIQNPCTCVDLRKPVERVDQTNQPEDFFMKGIDDLAALRSGRGDYSGGFEAHGPRFPPDPFASIRSWPGYLPSD